METRDALNEKMNEKLNLTKPMIAGIHHISWQNVVIVTNERYTAQDLIDNTDIIRFIFEYDRIQNDIQWFKTVIHGISIKPFNKIVGTKALRKDIELYNPGFRLATIPR